MALTPHNILLFNITDTNGNSSIQNNTNSSLGENYNRDNVFNPTTWNVIEIVVLGVVCFMILLGNALVILAFVKGPRSIRTHTNYFVVNLAVCDFMVGCLSVPFWMCVELKLVNRDLSKYFISLDVLFGTASILSLVAISIERMAAVHYATHHYNMSSRPVYISIIMTWFIGVLLFALKILVGVVYLIEYTIVVFVVSFLLPLAIIICSYIILFKSAYSLQRADNHTRAHSIRRDLQIAKTISIIIGLFVVCWAPFFAMNLLFVVCQDCLSTKDFVLTVRIAKVMHYSNSMMNFFVYAVRSPEFHRTFDALISCNTEDLRERLRSISVSSRKSRSASQVRRSNNNAGSFIDMEERNEKEKNGRLCEKSRLTVPSSRKDKHLDSITSDTVFTEVSSDSYPYIS